jgi:hypothetical protein
LFLVPVVGEVGPEREPVLVEVDFAVVHLGEHVFEGVEGVLVFFHGLADLVDAGFGADAVGDIGLVADGCAEVADFDFGVEFAAFTAADCADEVGGVCATAVALVLVDGFIFVVEGFAATAGDADVTVFALDVVTAAGAEVDGTVFPATFGIREVPDIDDDGGSIVVEEGEVHIGGLAVVVPEEAAAGGDDLGGDIIPAHDVAEIIDVVDAPVPHFAVAPVPLPMPVVVELLAHDGGHGGGAGPEVVVDIAGDGSGLGDFADGFAGAEFGAVDPFYFAVAAVLDIACAFLDGGTGALLCAGLDDAVVLAGGVDHLSAFPDGVADGFFDIDIFAGFAAPDGEQGVPVVGGGDDDGVDILAVEEVADILVTLDLVGALEVVFSVGFLDAVFEDFAVGIAESDDLDIGDGLEVLDMGIAAATDTDDADPDLVIGAAALGEQVGEVGECGCGSCGCEAAAEEGTTIESRFHVHLGDLCMGFGLPDLERDGYRLMGYGIWVPF